MREIIAVDMNIDTDRIRKQIVIQEGHRDQTLIIEQEEEDTEEIDHKVYVYNLYLKFSLSK